MAAPEEKTKKYVTAQPLSGNLEKWVQARASPPPAPIFPINLSDELSSYKNTVFQSTVG
jgi:hypothetical protein